MEKKIKIGRNELCPCGTEPRKKYKNCCMRMNENAKRNAEIIRKRVEQELRTIVLERKMKNPNVTSDKTGNILIFNLNNEPVLKANYGKLPETLKSKADIQAIADCNPLIDVKLERIKKDEIEKAEILEESHEAVNDEK